MLKKTALQCFFVMSVLCLGIAHALALMPPHIQSATPPNEGVLEGQTFVFSGYSLEYADAKKLKVILVKTGEEIEYTTETSCTLEGKCDDNARPGSCQEKCEMRVNLNKVVPGEQYEIHFLEWKSRFTAAIEKPEKKKEETPAK